MDIWIIQSDYYDLFDYQNISIMPQHYKILKFLDNGGNIINLLCLAVKYGRTVCRLLDSGVTSLHIQRVTEISTFILTGNRTHQKEQLFLSAILAKNVA
jgi:hypothetical protein